MTFLFFILGTIAPLVKSLREKNTSLNTCAEGSQWKGQCLKI